MSAFDEELRAKLSDVDHIQREQEDLESQRLGRLQDLMREVPRYFERAERTSRGLLRHEVLGSEAQRQQGLLSSHGLHWLGPEPYRGLSIVVDSEDRIVRVTIAVTEMFRNYIDNDEIDPINFTVADVERLLLRLGDQKFWLAWARSPYTLRGGVSGLDSDQDIAAHG